MKQFVREAKKFAFWCSVAFMLCCSCWCFYTTTEFWPLITSIVIGMGIYYTPKMFKAKVSTLPLALLFINVALINLQPRINVDFAGGNSDVALNWTILLVFSIITIISLRTPIKGLEFKARIGYEVIFLFIVLLTAYGLKGLVNCDLNPEVSYLPFTLFVSFYPTLFCQNIHWYEDKQN